MKYYKKTLIITLSSALVFTFYFIIAAYIHDPLQVFHKPWSRKTTFVDNMREQSLGIIKHYEFDSVIIGNSLLENTSGFEANDKIGGRFVNLSTSGLRYFERYTILKFALNKKHLENAIIQLDAYLGSGSPSSAAFVADAYEDNLFNQIKLYINAKYAKCIFLLSKSEKCIGKNIDLRLPNAWEERPEHVQFFGGYENWLKYKKTDELKIIYDALAKQNTLKVTPQELDVFKKTVRDYVVPLPKDNPDTNFHIIIPPYSILFWGNPIQHGISLEYYKEVVKTLLRETQDMENVKVYWFYNSYFMEDITEYKDMSHYSPKMNSMFIDAIANNKNILTLDNLDEYFYKLESKVEKFDNSQYVKVLEKELEQRKK